MRLSDGRITAIDPWRPGLPITMDLSHATVLPPLMDAHVHLAFSGTTDMAVRTAQLGQTAAQARDAVLGHLVRHWRCGVVAVRDGGDPGGDVLHCKKNILPLVNAPVQVAATCWAWHAPGRYGKMIGRAPAEGISPVQAVQNHLAGIDHLKVIQSGLNSIDRFGHQGSPQFSQADLAGMAAAAHAAGLPVMVHANGEIAVRMAIDAHCDSIEHGYFMGRDNLAYMADRAVFWVPTVIPMAALAEAPKLTAAQRDAARRTVDHQLMQIREAQAAGVVMAVGTDAGSQGVDHGTAVGQEIKLLMAAGLPLEAAVRCATANTARLMGFADHGELVPGRRADFIVIPERAEKLLAGMSEIVTVCMDGRFFDIDSSSP